MRWTVWLWMRLLLMADKLFSTRLLERELVRRQSKIDRLVADMDAVSQDLDALKEEVAFYQLVMCLVDLRARSESEDLDDWLCFVPHNDGEELLLNNVVEYLVKPRLADIDAVEVVPGQYIYRLHPDWAAIHSHLRDRSAALPLMLWLEQQAQHVQ